MANEDYSVTTTVWKAIKYGLLYGIPALVETYLLGQPGIASITVGSILTAALNYIKQHRD